MSEKIIIDASAVLALINKEDGYKIVEKYINNYVAISAINFAEVLTVTSRNNINQEMIIPFLYDIFPSIIEFCHKQAKIVSELDCQVKKYGLSFGDKACIALGVYKDLPILTADKVWQKLNLNQEIILIR